VFVTLKSIITVAASFSQRSHFGSQFLTVIYKR